MRKRIAILGSTGSVGQNVLRVAAAHPDRIEVVGLAAGENVELLAQQVATVRPRVVSVATEQALNRLIAALGSGGSAEIGWGAPGMMAVAAHGDVDLLVSSAAGAAALEPTAAALAAGKTVALANKEILVMAGPIMTALAARSGAAILPVDSEHNAIHQCLEGRPRAEVRRLVLTASGGPFRGHPADALEHVSPDEALNHPTWRMGRKITIDSATLMNKGLEVIEAHWLFGVPASRIEVVIHPQSVVHSMVEFVDGSVLAQLGVTDMRLPIQYALSYPERWASDVRALDVARLGSLTFEPPDPARFPCLALAYRALEAGNSMPGVLNAANEEAVHAFLRGEIRFTRIAGIIEQVMAVRPAQAIQSIDEVRAIDERARADARAIIHGTLVRS